MGTLDCNSCGELSKIQQILYTNGIEFKKLRSTIDKTYHQKLLNQPKAMLRLFDGGSGSTPYDVEEKRIKPSSRAE